MKEGIGPSSFKHAMWHSQPNFFNEPLVGWLVGWLVGIDFERAARATLEASSSDQCWISST